MLVALSASSHMKVLRILRVPDGSLGNDIFIGALLWFQAGRADVGVTAAAGAECAVGMVADRTFAHDGAVGVGGFVFGYVSGA